MSRDTDLALIYLVSQGHYCLGKIKLIENKNEPHLFSIQHYMTHFAHFPQYRNGTQSLCDQLGNMR